MATRWGICAVGRISNDFCTCLKSLPSSEHQIVAVAASNKRRAETFAAEFDIPKSYGSYEELAADPDIDVVYIGTLHTSHVENSLAFINASKNVLCEKPMSLTLDGCKRVLSAAQAKGILFVEGFWSRHFPVYRFIQEQIKSGALGEVIMVEATFCIPKMDDERIQDPKLGGGALMDIGVYVVQAANLVFKGKPETIIADGSKTESGVDKTAAILLRYPGNKFASLAYSIETSPGASSFTIRGTKGNLVVPDLFWCPDRVVLQGNEEKCFQLPHVENAEKLNYPNSQGFVYEAQEVRRCLLNGLKESPFITHDDSETIMSILQEVQKQLGIKYDFP